MPASPLRVAAKGLQIAALVAVVWWLVIPRLGDTADVFRLVDQVPPVMLGLGALLGLGAFAAYAQVTRTLLPDATRPRPVRTLGIVISSVAVNRTAPLGMAAGSVVTYRLLRREGVDSPDVAFAMTVQAVGSAVLLQALLWSAMLPLAPLTGFAPGVVAVGAVGVLTLSVLAAVVWALAHRPAAVAGLLGGVARRLPRGTGDRAVGFVDAANARLTRLLADRTTLVRGTVWGLANWILDAASLWVFLVAFGAEPSPLWVFVAFGVANVISMIPLSPGGLGIVETTIAATLIGVGSAAAPVFVGVAAYRLVHYWLPIPTGALAYLLLRVTSPRRAIAGVPVAAA